MYFQAAISITTQNRRVVKFAEGKPMADYQQIPNPSHQQPATKIDQMRKGLRTKIHFFKISFTPFLTTSYLCQSCQKSTKLRPNAQAGTIVETKRKGVRFAAGEP